MDTSPRHRLGLLALVILLLAGGGIAAYFLWLRAALPTPGSPEYLEYLRAFQVGVAALDTDRKDIAQAKLDRAIALVPQEPAGWANRGLLYLRKNLSEDLDQAAHDLEEARRRAPDSAAIQALLGHLAERQGKLPDAIRHFEEATRHDARDLTTLYALAEAVSKESGDDSDAKYQQALEKILRVQPNNLFVLAKHIRMAFERKDAEALRADLARFDQLAPGWSKATRSRLADLHTALKDAPADVPVRLSLLENMLRGERGFSRDAIAVQHPQALVGIPLQQFLVLVPPRATPAPADRDLTFTVTPTAAATATAPPIDASRWDVARTLYLLSAAQRDIFLNLIPRGGMVPRPPGSFKPVVFVANARAVRRTDIAAPALAFPGGKQEVAPTPAGVLPMDWDNDFRTDLLLAGAGGLRFFLQRTDGGFADVTDNTGLPDAILNGDYFGAWAADVDTDGDLDIVLARRTGPPLFLRNNRDGTFTAVEVKAFAAVAGARAFAWADLDNDGAPDAVFLDAAGTLRVFANERFGQFTAVPLPDEIGKVLAVTVADVHDTGRFGLVALRADGDLVSLVDQDRRAAWKVEKLAHWPGANDAAPGTVALFAEDLDNNGATDLVVAGPRETHVFLADETFRFTPPTTPVPMHTSVVVDLDGRGRLDLLGVSAAGKPVRAASQGGKEYHAQTIWTVANPQAGDGRNNSFAVGAEVEVRAGMLVMKRLVDAPGVHFGLGDQAGLTVARFVWPNGVPTWEFEPPADPVLVEAQRLNSSCPFLFADDGTGVRFVADFMWNTPLGMYVNGHDTSAFGQTTEWLKVRGDQLAAKDGYYDLRVQANLWEADYFDQLGLIVVDHPPDTEIYADERFALNPTPPELYVTTPARPVARAWDHLGQDATDEVRAIDGRYLDRCGRGRFQGVTRDHWVEIDLGDDAPTEGPIYLIARGWLHPTDSSINVALAQGKHDPPRGLVLEVPDGQGGWKVGRPALGFPAGKDKTMLIRLDGIDGAGVSRRVRLRTNMEIYWDFLGYARRLDTNLARLQRPTPVSAELRYLGILEMTQKDASSPEVPRYDKVSRGQQPWRDLAGYYTRFGDVRELLTQVDDRYVIMNAGDEIALRFPAPAAAPPGWQRDFIWECDGWTRDGNPNTRYGTTVLPLPAHDLKTFAPPTGRLADDPVYRRFPEDWTNYHTRYVTPDRFAQGLRTFRRSAGDPIPRR